MLRKINGTNFFNIKILARTNIKCQNGTSTAPGSGLLLTHIHNIDFIMEILQLSIIPGPGPGGGIAWAWAKQ
jgi:hypothetical protein